MRISLYQFTLVFVFAAVAQAHSGKAQAVLDRRVTLQIENQTIIQTLEKIEKVTGVKFVYAPDIFRPDARVSINFKNSRLEKVLSKILPSFNVAYEVDGNDIVLKQAYDKKSSLDEMKPGIEQAMAGTMVTGKLTDSKGDPLIGATVSLKGTTNGVVTDIDGKYSIQIPNADAENQAGIVLVFSMVGYKSKEVEVGSQTIIDIQLEEDVKTIDEVVVVGYGDQKKETMTGAVSVVSSKTFEDRGILSNPVAAMQGQIPGVVVTRSSAQPGRDGWSFLIRGVSSTNSNPPLVIVDGVPLPDNAGLNSLNPADIESMSVLKDASAAIYGSRAAAGVILITTKKAKAGKTTIQYSANVAMKVRGLAPQLANLKQYGSMMLEALNNDNNTSNGFRYLAPYMINPPASGYMANDLGVFTDVYDFTFFDKSTQDILWGNAYSQSHNLNISGRGEKSGYRVSLGYLSDGSLLQWGKNYNRRYNARLSYDFRPVERLNVETNLSYEKQDITDPSRMGDVLGLYAQPGFPESTINGKPYGWGSQHSANWIAELGGDQNEYNTRINTNLKLTYDLAKGLQAVCSFGYNYWVTDIDYQEKPITWYDYTETHTYSSQYPERSFYRRTYNKNAYYMLNGYLQYSKTLGSAHNIKAMSGAQYERNEYAGFYAYVYDLQSVDVPSLNLSLAGTQYGSEYKNHWAMGSYFTRVNYDYKGKYLLEANLRYDGTSKFTADKKWQWFYGVSAGWKISDENFLKDIAWLSSLKLRASYGSLGQQGGIGLYDYVQLLKVVSSTGASANPTPIIGTGNLTSVTQDGNIPTLQRTWERVNSYNTGVDWAFFNNRLSGSLDYYVKYNNNMLAYKSYPGTIGASTPQINIGTLKTWGWETSVGWRDKKGGLSYYINLNFSDSQNKLVSFGGQTLIGDAGYADNSTSKPYVEGYPITSYYGYVYAGRIQTQDQLSAYQATAASLSSRLRMGDNMYKDINGDGQVNANDKAYLGSDAPRYTFGFNFGGSWKGFDVAVILQGVGQRTIIRDDYWSVPLKAYWLNISSVYYNNTWTPNHTDAYYPELSLTNANYNYLPSDWRIQNGAYIRLKNLVVGYTIPQKLSNKIKLEKLRVYFSGNDLCEITALKDGWDPETVYNPTYGGRYPFYRYLSMGIDVTF